MDWSECIKPALDYIEENLCENISVADIAKRACISPYYFQRIFSIVCGITLGEYIRKRRLSAAALEVKNSGDKIIDIALRYGYDSPDSFTRAFCRFHGNTPSAVRRGCADLKIFAPLNYDSIMKGRFNMNYRIEKKEAFCVKGFAKKFRYENGPAAVPLFWKEFFEKGRNRTVCGMYGINTDLEMTGEEFEYMIADDSDMVTATDDGLETRIIPAHTWAVFECRGPSAKVMPETNRYIFTEWLPNSNYEFAEGINLEMYTDASKYPDGITDENYYSEIWIAVKEK